ncbi:hypothetical protein NK553_28255 [Pseudomonas sp. ZM23]|uniref:Methyltransferase type 11 domain-containing protein n=1 Tax=Pseudomonas triclosanedens TaxID=2961893 RepID=A0ABY6ZXI7_9PSED|nr:hypothetical protein [Pseudomonas triclosanedens]MCP8467849.1 hypothetical protein [Pseudomonas triclosanedens]MCP8469950.1 hypothetical protein [Pseudomonas triclosanedens]MCP8477860.1 hypothetical protein [Pseudomonas triclosanedens]WAI49282.1 hypothetical protein OU419_26665 [Pseudomonas triclosanedens]
MFSNFRSTDVPRSQATEAFAAKINIGCGYNKLDGYLNLDCDPACQPDILIQDNDLYSLPRNHFVEVFAKDVLEHIPREHMMSALFDWASILRMGGTLYVQTSWIYGIIDIMRQANDFETVHNWKICLFGNQVHPGDWHFNGFTEVTLRVYLTAVGFRDSGFSIEDGWLISTRATKVDDWSYLIELSDYDEFVSKAYRVLLGREPEDWRFDAGFRTEAGSKARYLELRSLACSAERLYKIGKELEGGARLQVM